MYVHEVARALYLAHPRTASSATAKALQEQAGFQLVGDHHSGPNGLDLSGWTVMTTVRNHFDALVSLWFLQDRSPPLGPRFWESFLTSANGERYPDPRRLYALHLPVATDVLRFERLGSDLNTALATVGLGPVTLGHHHRTEARAGRPYSEFYDSQSRAWVERQFGAEMRELGYSWDTRAAA